MFQILVPTIHSELINFIVFQTHFKSNFTKPMWPSLFQMFFQYDSLRISQNHWISNMFQHKKSQKKLFYFREQSRVASLKLFFFSNHSFTSYHLFILKVVMPRGLTRVIEEFVVSTNSKY